MERVLALHRLSEQDYTVGQLRYDLWQTFGLTAA